MAVNLGIREPSAHSPRASLRLDLWWVGTRRCRGEPCEELNRKTQGISKIRTRQKQGYIHTEWHSDPSIILTVPVELQQLAAAGAHKDLTQISPSEGLPLMNRLTDRARLYREKRSSCPAFRFPSFIFFR